jgi:hypothetical protein
MAFTLVETNGIKAKNIAVRPFFDNSVSNMGLENYGLSLFDGVSHFEQLACLERNGVTRYLTGLNEFAPEIKLLPNEEREAIKMQIRSAVAELEKELAANVLNIEDENFWNKVQLLKPDNSEFWNKITISCSNEPLYLDPKDPYDRIKLYAIEAGGFALVAKSYDDARSRAVPPKFYLDKEQETVTIKTEYKKLKNRALSELQKLYDKNSTKLMYIAKVVDGTSIQYKRNTPNDTIYDNMDRFINGEGVEGNKTRAAQSFLDACNLDMETLKIKSIIKDCVYYKYISTKSDGHIYHVETDSILGKNVVAVLEYLKNPLHEDILKNLNDKVEKIWSE